MPDTVEVGTSLFANKNSSSDPIATETRDSAGYAKLSKPFMDFVFDVLKNDERSLLVLCSTYYPNIRPSLDTLTRRMGFRDRESTRRILKKLVSFGLLIPVDGVSVGGRPTLYRFPDLDSASEAKKVRSRILADQAKPRQPEEAVQTKPPRMRVGKPTTNPRAEPVSTPAPARGEPPRRTGQNPRAGAVETYIEQTPEHPKKTNNPHTPASGGRVVSVRKCRFAEFWEAWPQHHRKKARPQCEKLWKSRKLDEIADQILASLERWKQSEPWIKDGGAYIPGPKPWLNQASWETPLGQDEADIFETPPPSAELLRLASEAFDREMEDPYWCQMQLNAIERGEGIEFNDAALEKVRKTAALCKPAGPTLAELMMSRKSPQAQSNVAPETSKS